MNAPLLLRSDNVSGVSPAVMRALADVADGDMAPYGDDPITLKLQARFAALFDHECVVAPVSSGIAANALGVSLLAGPMDAVVCHHRAHIVSSEGGSVEFFSQGARLVHLDGADGKLDPSALDRFLAHTDFKRAAVIPPRVVSLTQITELGTVYPAETIRRLSEVSRRHDMRMHMDGARFANAIAALNCHPADISWRAGVDVLSFGATKNGTMSADAVVIFDPALAATLERRRRRSGQSMSKMRFMSAQLIAMLDNDLWLDNARQANRMAQMLADGLAKLPGFELRNRVDGNLLFVWIEPETLTRLTARGIAFRPADAIRTVDSVFRLVTSFATAETEIVSLLHHCRLASAA